MVIAIVALWALEKKTETKAIKGWRPTATPNEMISVHGATRRWRPELWQESEDDTDDEGAWEIFDAKLAEIAEAKFSQRFIRFLSIPVEAPEPLQRFLVGTDLFAVLIRATPAMRKLLPKSIEENSETYSFRVELDILRVQFRDENEVFRRLVAAAAVPPPSPFENNTRVPFDVVRKKFDSIVNQCCMHARQPFSYLDRCICPPDYVLGEQYISLPIGTFVGGRLWLKFIFREVHRRLTVNGPKMLQFGQDKYFHTLDDDKPLVAMGVTSHDSFAILATGVAFTFGGFDVEDVFSIARAVPTVSIAVLLTDAMRNTLVHLITAKVISRRTGLDESACRQLFRLED
jgi:hypothetical protein